MTKSFFDQKWLEENPLTNETVLAYFALSPFYDRSCLNEIIQMQTQFSNFFDMNKKLQEMDGLRYVVEEKNDIFYIFKVQKTKNVSKTVDFHYVMFGTIFKGTTQNTVTRSRLNNFLYFINESIGKYVQKRSYDPFEGFHIKKTENTQEFDETAKKEMALTNFILSEIALKNDEE